MEFEKGMPKWNSNSCGVLLAKKVFFQDTVKQIVFQNHPAPAFIKKRR